MALVRKRTILTERPLHVGEGSANFCGWRVSCGAQWIATAINLGFLDLEPLPFHSSSSSVILMRLSGPRYRPTTPWKIW
jgi:hypothetical protein